MTLSMHVRRVSAVAAAGLVAGLVAVPALTTPASAVPAAPETGCAAYSAPTTVDSTDAAVPIPGPDNVAEQEIEVTDPGRIAWVRVHTEIDHAYNYDVDAVLVTPSGTEITLTRQNGGGVDNGFSDTWFDDDAPQPAVGAAYVNLVAQPLLAPEEALSNARGEVAAGTWTLRVVDEYPPEDDGTLNGWSLEYATYTGASPDVTEVHSTAGTTGTVAQDAVGSFTATVAPTVVSTVENATVQVNLDAATDSDDMDATLIAPSGSRVKLVSQDSPNDNEGDFLGTTFTDDAGSTHPPGTGDDNIGTHTNGTFAPVQPFASLRGEAAAGTWTLEVRGVEGAVGVGAWNLTLGLASCGTDTRVTTSPAPDHVQAGGLVAYAVSARNVRSSVARDVKVTVSPGGGTLASIATTQGTCAGAVCTLGTLEPGASASVVFLVRAGSGGVLKPTASVAQSVGDATPADNTVTFTTTVDPLVEAPDTTKPGVVMTLGDATLEQVAEKGLKVLVGGTEKGRLKLTLKVSGTTAKALGIPKKLGTATTRLTKAGTVKVTLKVTKKHRDELAGSKKPVKLIVKATLTDAAGNVGKGSANGTYGR